VAVDLPHYQRYPHLQSCWQKNMGLQAKKYGLAGCDVEDRHEGGCGSSSSVSSEAEYFSMSLSESITISHI